MSRRFLATILIGAFAAPLAEAAPPPRAIARIRAVSGAAFPGPAQLDATPSWATNEEGAQEFFWTVRLPDGGARVARWKVVDLRGGERKALEGRGADPIRLPGVSQKVSLELEGGGTAVAQMDLQLSQAPRVWGACDDARISLEPLGIPEEGKLPVDKFNAKVPGYVVFRCDRDGANMLLSVSVPDEVDWRTMSLYERQGKGKRYKTFAFEPQTLRNKDTELGRFVLGARGREYVFVARMPRAKDVARISDFTFGLGPMALYVRSGGREDSLTKPAASVTVEFRPFHPRLAFSGHGLSSLPVLGKAGFLMHTETVSYLGWTFGSEAGWRFEPRASWYFADGVSEKIEKYYAASVPGAGFRLETSKQAAWRFALEGLYGTAGGSSVMSARASVERQAGFGEIGVRAIYTTLSAAGDGGAEKTEAGQTTLAAYLSF